MKKRNLTAIATKTNVLSKAKSTAVKGGTDIIGISDHIMNLIVITDTNVG